jgi:hypothetical protein
MFKFAFVDDQMLCKDFRTDDVVRKSSLRDYVLTPYSGRVLFSNPRTGKVAVQWPWGVESESPAELVKMENSYKLPIQQNSGYDTYESATHTRNDDTKKANAEWRKSVASEITESLKRDFEASHKNVYHAACKQLHDDKSEKQAKEIIRLKFAATNGFDACDSIVGDVYGQGFRLALYWKAQQRRYQSTRREKATKRYSCPKCRELMKPLRYRFKEDLNHCGVCGFTIYGGDIL